MFVSSTILTVWGSAPNKAIYMTVMYGGADDGKSKLVTNRQIERQTYRPTVTYSDLQ